ncbi:transmembrane protein 268-like [Polyodon spathula]|uniref:transmembrane protein 268-like n=1 Tax=Polyodon spathula TaxID=7913 RepID=UPI001B7DC67A|nr:transmembrane protein 268-like [Polyodon spathula]
MMGAREEVAGAPQRTVRDAARALILLGSRGHWYSPQMPSDRTFSELMEESPLDPPSPSCCKSALSNGQVLQVLTADNTLSSTGEFDLQGCTERLRTLGVQVSCSQYREELHQAVTDPELRRYLFFSSRAFSMAIAVLCYVTVWVNLYTSLRLVSTATPWSLSVLVSVSAALLTVALVLLLDRHRTRMNTNTDMRLAGVNERLLRHKLLLGITELLQGGHARLQLWFVYFDLAMCRQTLTSRMENWKSSKPSQLRERLDQLCVIISKPLSQSEEGRAGPLAGEDIPLLSSLSTGGRSERKSFSFSQVVRLVPDGTPQEMADRLLFIYSGAYVRLLACGLLPRVSSGLHGAAPCVCQFIEVAVLGSDSPWCWRQACQ